MANSSSKELFVQLAKFGVVGGIAFVIDLGVLLFCTRILSVETVWASVPAFLVALCFNYVASKRFVFTSTVTENTTRDFLIFGVLSLIGLGINALILFFGEYCFGNEVAVITTFKVLSTVIVALWNFITRKVLLER